MKTINVTWKGTTPLIMHSCRCVNPLHPLTKELAKYTSKKKKSEEDHQMISDLEWLSGLYYHEDIKNPLKLSKDMFAYVPAENIEATIINGAKANKKGKDIQKFVTMKDMFAPLELPESKTLAQLWKDFKYRDVRQMVIMRNRITRTRPRFDRWSINFNLMYDEDQIDVETIINAMEYAGQYVGLCDSRPKYGKFNVVVKEV